MFKNIVGVFLQWDQPNVKKYRFFSLNAIVRSITFLTGLLEAERLNRSLRCENRGPKSTGLLPE